MKKGFTLIELLAVIVILAIIALIATPIIINIINDSREESYKRSIELYGDAVEQAIATYQINNPNNKIEGEYHSSSDGMKLFKGNDEVLPIDYEGSIVECSNIQVYEKGTIYMSGCSVGGHSVDYTYGTPLCELQDGTSKEVSSKYICHLDKDRIFYVLENNESSENISLIMDRNFIDDYVHETLTWCTDGGDNNTLCKNINTTGEDAPEGKDYIGHITQVFNATGVTVSFPTKEQLEASSVGCTTTSGSCSTWVYDYLYSTVYPVSGVFGYWTASPSDDNYDLAWRVGEVGRVELSDISLDSSYGVRPVITISKSLLD